MSHHLHQQTYPAAVWTSIFTGGVMMPARFIVIRTFTKKEGKLEAFKEFLPKPEHLGGFTRFEARVG